jgi:acetate CoA/acetoacetate CoA-transferase beta subunit
LAASRASGRRDLVAGAKRVVVSMRHNAKVRSKIVEALSLPQAAARRVGLFVAELAPIEPTDEGLVLLERAPGVSVEERVANIAAPLVTPREHPKMSIDSRARGVA